MKIDGIWFNQESAQKKTLTQFIAQNQHLNPLGKRVVKDEWLREVYNILVPSKESRRTRASKSQLSK